MAGRVKIPRKKRFFIGCEGESEQGYAALLQRFASEMGLAVHIVAKVMAKSGDPLAMAERAIATIDQESGGSKPQFAERFLLFDTDLIGRSPSRDQRIAGVAAKGSLTLIRQDRCFESFLIRHFEGHENDQPATNTEALNRVKSIWPQYRKGSSAQELAVYIKIEHVRRAALNPLNKDHAHLLDALGLNA